MNEEIYDVVVLGGGAGGVPAAIRASQLGGKVALIESRDLGGQCMNRGCISLGHMMLASHIVKDLALGKDMGLCAPDITLEYPALIKRQDELISFMRQGVRTTLKKNHVDVIEGKGRIAGKGAIDAEGKNISYKKLILATGAQWQKPEFPGAELEEVVNTDFLFSAQALPQRALLYGESSWLIEIAQFLTRFGSKVTLATPQKRILSEESKTIATRLRKILRDEGIEITTNTTIKNVRKKKEGLFVDLSFKEGPQEVVVDTIITLERAAALKGIGLKTINLDEESSFLAVNEKTETAQEGVYAIGDLTAPPEQHYSHRAAEMGIVAAENAMGNDTSLNFRNLPRVLFTHPEVASIGFTPQEAKAMGYEVVVGAAPLSMNPFGMILAESEGIIEVVADKSYGEILGAHVIATAASEMIGQALVAIQIEATLHELAATPFPHPTLSESLAEAARDALGYPIYLP
jgi:dihydrolipoamide dehydrogenase